MAVPLNLGALADSITTEIVHLVDEVGAPDAVTLALSALSRVLAESHGCAYSNRSATVLLDVMVSCVTAV